MKTFKKSLNQGSENPETDFDRISKETRDEKYLRNFREIRSLVYRHWLEQESKLNKIKRKEQLDLLESISFSNTCDLEEKYRRNLEVLDQNIEALTNRIFKNKPGSETLKDVCF